MVLMNVSGYCMFSGPLDKCLEAFVLWFGTFSFSLEFIGDVSRSGQKCRHPESCRLSWAAFNANGASENFSVYQGMANNASGNPLAYHG